MKLVLVVLILLTSCAQVTPEEFHKLDEQQEHFAETIKNLA